MKFINKFKILFTKAEIRKIGFLFIGIVFMGILEVVGVASIAPFMAVVSNPEVIETNLYLNLTYNYFSFTSTNSFLVFLGCAVLILLVSSNAYTAFISWQIIYFVKMQNHFLSLKLLRGYLMQPYLFFLNRNTSDLGKNVLVEVGRSIEGVILPALLTLSKLVVAFFIVLFLFFVDYLLATSILVILGGSYFLIFRLVRGRLSSIGLKTTEMILNRFKTANEAMSGIKELKLRNSENEFIDRFSIPSEKNAQYASQSSLISSLPRYALEAIAFGGIVAIVIYLIVRGRTGGEVIPIISLYAVAGYRLMPALQVIYAGVTGARYNLPALEILVKDLNSLKESSLIDSDNSAVVDLKDKIKIDSLCFSYPNTKSNVINDFNLEIKANTTVGLVGSTGSGKTTVVDLILGLLSSQSGTILVDGKEITQANILGWQKNLGYISQTIFLSDDTIERNIAFGVPDSQIDKTKIKRACKWAELDDFVNSLEERYQTIIGERGVRLSGGQRQRIGIARALYHDPKVLVMDEATSSLDRVTENIIIETIKNFSHKKTIIMIAHRLATIKECDVIHVMENGTITDSGDYENLMESNKKFKQFAET